MKTIIGGFLLAMLMTISAGAADTSVYVKGKFKASHIVQMLDINYCGTEIAVILIDSSGNYAVIPFPAKDNAAFDKFYDKLADKVGDNGHGHMAISDDKICRDL